MRKMYKNWGQRAVSWVLSAAMVCGLLPAVLLKADAIGTEYNTIAPSSGEKFFAKNDEIYYLEKGNYYNWSFVVPQGIRAKLIVPDKTSINNQAMGGAPIDIQNGASLFLVVEDELKVFGENGVLGSSGRLTQNFAYAGISVAKDARLFCSGAGTLYAYGGDASDGDYSRNETDYGSAFVIGGGGAGAGIGGNGGPGGANRASTGAAPAVGTIIINSNVHAFGGGGGSGGPGAKLGSGVGYFAGGGGGYPAAGIGGGGAGGGAGDYSGGGFSGGSGVPSATPSGFTLYHNIGIDGNNGGNEISYGYGYFYDGGGRSHENGNLGGTAGSGGTVVILEPANVYAQNGSYLTTQTNSYSSPTPILAQLGYSWKDIRASSMGTINGRTETAVEQQLASQVKKTLDSTLFSGIGSGAGYLEISNGSLTTIQTVGHTISASSLNIRNSETYYNKRTGVGGGGTDSSRHMAGSLFGSALWTCVHLPSVCLKVGAG